MVFKTPGVYVQEIASFPASVAQVETAIPAFIGYTEITVDEPVRITSMLEYEQIFGGAYAERFTVDVTVGPDVEVSPAIPASGTGSTAVAAVPAVTTPGEVTAVSINSFTPSVHNLYYALQMFFANGGGPCYVASAGEYSTTATTTVSKEKLEDALSKLEKEDEPTLIVIPEATKISALSDVGQLYKSALDMAEKLQDRFVIIDTKVSNTSVNGVMKDASDLRDSISNGSSLKYGAAYYPDLLTGLNYEYTDASVKVKIGTASAIELTKLADVADAKYDFALYTQVKAFITGNLDKVIMPPSSAIAGIYAKVDSTVGVWKAPANVGLNLVTAPTVKISSEEQEDLNVHTTGKSINAIRTFTGKGTLVWGARTLDGNSGEWKYVPVRRFFNMVEESVKKATERFVFEPNVSTTWVRVRATIENFLNQQWRDGALAGATPEEAFYVRVGLNETMIAQDILDGKMIIEIGMAAVRPAEFIILRFSHKLQES